MKIIISKGLIKRQIDGDFAICGDKESLTRLRNALTEGLREDDGRGVFSYGWVEVRSEGLCAPNTQPRPWDE